MRLSEITGRISAVGARVPRGEPIAELAGHRGAVRAIALSADDQWLATGDEELVEDSPNDYYWGRGRSGTGKNMLGRILMEVRDELRSGT